MPLPSRPRPRVVIVGGGLGGLMMGILLEKMDVPYQILERAVNYKPLGSLMGFNANILGVFEQLGLLDEVLDISYPSKGIVIYNEQRVKTAEVSMTNYADLAGYDNIIFSRSDLHDIMTRQVPAEKILMGKRVLSVKETDEGVVICCSDNTSYEADIVIGADGAYSAVRQCIYKDAAEAGSLPASDHEDLAIPFVCMVGTTDPQSVEKYPQLKNPEEYVHHVIGNSATPYTWSTRSIPGHRFCWTVTAQVTDQTAVADQRFRCSEWGPESNESMVKMVRGFPLPIGENLTLGDMIDTTPMDGICKVMLEEKLFETWSFKRTVLIGDDVTKRWTSCHSKNMCFQGAINAMQDAVILANCLYDLPDLTPKSITAAFLDYKEQRYPQAKKLIGISKMNALITTGQTILDRILRYATLSLVPRWLQHAHLRQGVEYRPQIMFLPLIDDKGTVPSLPRNPSKRYQAELVESKAGNVSVL
ncbi:hypothetical protein BGX28_007180 [Mortierella sp. GBA30]|nr:hypothetical protein BGX28_007180 [Mortierella sp. GBA30]